MSIPPRRRRVPCAERSCRYGASSLEIVGRSTLAALLLTCVVHAASEERSPIDAATAEQPSGWTLQARLVASRLTGAHGIRQVGRFHVGGPFTGNPEFLMTTQAGRVLDP